MLCLGRHPGPVGGSLCVLAEPACRVVFCLLWAGLVALVYQRGRSYAAALGAETLTVYSGIVLRRAIRCRAVTGIPAAHAAAPAGRGIGGRHHGTGHAAYFTGGPGRAGRCPGPCAWEEIR